MSDYIDRAEAQTAIQFVAKRYTVAHEAHGNGRVVWSDILIALTDAMNALRDVPSAQQWIPCSEKLPKRIINGNVETVQEFFVTVKERWPGEEWSYHTDIAEFPGDYIDDIWQTYNDWREGQEVHVIAWMPLPKPWRGEDDERSDQ